MDTSYISNLLKVLIMFSENNLDGLQTFLIEAKALQVLCLSLIDRFLKRLGQTSMPEKISYYQLE